MNKIIALLLSLILLFSLAACAKDKDTNSADVSADNSGTDDAVTVNIGSLKGPTTMGIVNLMKSSENGELVDKYNFTMATDASEIVAGVVSGNIDIALIPANLAAVLYNTKTDKGITVIDINTLGVLYCVTGNTNIKSIKDLAGKTVIMTGQGTTPEYALRYLLEANGIKDCTIEFKSEATEVAAVLASDPTQIAILPQPFATVAQVQNDALHEAFSLSDEWNEVSDDSMLVTGVTVVRNEFLEANPDAVTRFLTAHQKSVKQASEDAEGTAKLVAEYGIIEKAPIAQKALPKCGIAFVVNDEMKSALEGYLQVLFDADPSSVGGTMPDEKFYMTTYKYGEAK